MKHTIKAGFKMIFLIGLTLLFVSLFVDWYSFYAVNSEGQIVISWSYHLFSEWRTIFAPDAVYNEFYHPENASLPVYIHIIFTMLILIAAYSVLFKDVENTTELHKLRRYGYLEICLLLLNLFYLVIFPVMYLLPNELYYPFVMYTNNELELLFVYNIGMGYVLQSIGFTLTFAYSIFYYQTVMKFERERTSPQKMIESFIQTVKEPLDLDKFIAEEQVRTERPKTPSKPKPKSKVDQIYTEFLETRS